MTDAELIRMFRWMGRDLADRIEALIAERDEYHSEAMTYIEKWGAARKAQDEAEAKLAKAVEALELIVVDNTWGLEHQTYMKCRKALAEIKGESHE